MEDDALFTRGWERTVQFTGVQAKAVKQEIVSERIVPPRDPGALLEASQP